MKTQLPVKPILVVLAAVLAIYTAAGVFLLPYLAEQILVNKGKTLIGAAAGVERIRFNPYTLEAEIRNLDIRSMDGKKLLSVRELRADFSITSLFRQCPVLTGLQIETPELVLERRPDNTLNISDILGDFATDAGSPEPDGKALESRAQFRLEHFRINGGGIVFSDRVTGTDHHIRALNLDIPLLSSLEADLGNPAEATLGFRLNQSGVTADIQSRLFGPGGTTQIHVTSSGIDLTPYTPYLHLPEWVEPEAPGRLALDLLVSFAPAHTDKGARPVLGMKGKLGLEDFRMQIRDHETGNTTPFVACPQLAVETDVSDFFNDGLKLVDVQIREPELHLKRNADGELRILKLLNADGLEKPDTKRTGNAPFAVELVHGQINRGNVIFSDESVAPGFSTTLAGVNLSLEDLTAGEKIAGTYTAAFATESAENASASGNFSVGDVSEFHGRLALEALRPGKYLPYYAPFIGDRLGVERADLQTDFSLSFKDGQPGGRLEKGQLALSGIRLKQNASQQTAIDLERCSVSGFQMDLDRKQITVAGMDAGNGRIRIHRDDVGNINLVESLADIPLFQGMPGKDESEHSVAVSEPHSFQAAPWTVKIQALSLENHTLELLDEMHKEPVNIRLSDIHITAENINTASGEKGHLSAAMAWQQEGKIDLDGSFTLSGPGGTLDLSLEAVDLKSFQPYFTDHLNILVSRGSIQSKGRIVLSMADPGAPDISFRGQAALNDFLSQNKATGNDFFRCGALYLDGMDISLFPVRVSVDEIALADFYQKAVLSKTGRFNLRDVIVQKQGVQGRGRSEKDMPGSATPPEVNIGTITIQGGHVNFTDYFTTPNFTANMTGIAGSVTGLSSQGQAPAEVRLKGTHGRHSPLDIAGRIDLLKKERFVDATVSFKNIELPEFNAYAMKYLGYKIDKGKLVLDLNYNIRGNALSSQNRLFFDQLTLGDRVDSKDATSLPVQLAISLLKNARGEIDLDLPVKGNLDDPEFSYGSVVVKTFQNLILSVVQAPFRFLGTLLGIGGEELGFVAYAPGRAVLEETSREKLDRLISILAEKENISLEITGQYDVQKDDEELRASKYETLLRSYLPGKSPEGSPPVPLTGEMRERAISQAYADAAFPKPRDESGREKALGFQDMETLLITNIVITETELEWLARQRRDLIRDYIFASGKIDSRRIFIRDPGRVDNEDPDSRYVKTTFVLK
ncbi:MAG: DUF748 domain-containing protein [Desulfobacter sp.]